MGKEEDAQWGTLSTRKQSPGFLWLSFHSERVGVGGESGKELRRLVPFPLPYLLPFSPFIWTPFVSNQHHPFILFFSFYCSHFSPRRPLFWLVAFLITLEFEFSERLTSDFLTRITPLTQKIPIDISKSFSDKSDRRPWMFRSIKVLSFWTMSAAETKPNSLLFQNCLL